MGSHSAKVKEQDGMTCNLVRPPMVATPHTEVPRVTDISCQACTCHLKTERLYNTPYGQSKLES